MSGAERRGTLGAVAQVVAAQPVAPVMAQRARELRRRTTPAEALLWRQLRGGRFYGWHFRRQQVIDGFIADFYCHAAALVVEVDGGVHRLRGDEDANRDQVLAARGHRILRLTNMEVTNTLNAALARIKALLDTSPSPGSAETPGERPHYSPTESPAPQAQPEPE